MRAIDADLLEPDADYDDGEFWAYSKTQVDNAPTITPVHKLGQILNLFVTTDYVVLYREQKEFFVGSVSDVLSNQEYRNMLVCRLIALESDVIGVEIRKEGGSE